MKDPNGAAKGSIRLEFEIAIAIEKPETRAERRLNSGAKAATPKPASPP